MKVQDFIEEDKRLSPSPDVAVGVEVELENCEHELSVDRRSRVVGTIALPYGIDAHRDGSLRNGGIELVTKPIRGDAIRDNVRYICDLAEREDWTPSNRAGIHVHVDVQQLELKKLLDYLKVYTLVEPLLFNFASDGRENSIYCKAWYEIETSSLARFIDDTNKMEARELGLWHHLDTRYIGLNLEACRKYGTVEFRHLRSTIDFDRIMKWIDLLLKIREYSQTIDITKEWVQRLTPTSILTLMGLHEFYFSDWESFFYHRSLPTCTELFFPAPREPIRWAVRAEQKRGHTGFKRFAQRKAPTLESDKVPNPNFEHGDGEDFTARILAAYQGVGDGVAAATLPVARPARIRVPRAQPIHRPRPVIPDLPRTYEQMFTFNLNDEEV